MFEAIHDHEDFLDYYFQHLGYIAARKERRIKFDEDTSKRGLTHSEHQKEWKSYCGRERVVLRRRRAKLRVEQFHIITQVGQGGYGEVYLARKQETGEVCALKRMKKKTLQKMDEVGHFICCVFMPYLVILDPACVSRTRHLDGYQNAVAGTALICLPR